MTDIYLLRTCRPDGRSSHGFVWPRSGPVEAPDWDPRPRCGGGLHALPWGVGNALLLDWSADAAWLVVRADEADVVRIDGLKVKFRRGEVVHWGDRKSATDYIIARGADPATVIGAFITGGDWAKITGGYKAVVTGGYGAVVTGGHGAVVTGGEEATVTGGEGATLICRWYDGNRHRVAVAYVGENGILPDVPYCVEKGKFIKATKV